MIASSGLRKACIPNFSSVTEKCLCQALQSLCCMQCGFAISFPHGRIDSLEGRLLQPRGEAIVCVPVLSLFSIHACVVRREQSETLCFLYLSFKSAVEMRKGKYLCRSLMLSRGAIGWHCALMTVSVTATNIISSIMSFCKRRILPPPSSLLPLNLYCDISGNRR